MCCWRGGRCGTRSFNLMCLPCLEALRLAGGPHSRSPERNGTCPCRSQGQRRRRSHSRPGDATGALGNWSHPALSQPCPALPCHVLPRPLAPCHVSCPPPSRLFWLILKTCLASCLMCFLPISFMRHVDMHLEGHARATTAEIALPHAGRSSLPSLVPSALAPALRSRHPVLFSSLYYTLLYSTLHSYTIRYYTMLCYAMLCYAILCDTVLCNTML